MPVRVYKYGLLPPTENASRVREQMLLAHRYRNTLTEIERGRRAAIRATTSRDDILAMETECRALKDAREAACVAIKRARSATRTRSDTEAQRQLVRDLRTKEKEAVRVLRERRAAMREDIDALRVRDAINERAAELQRSARAHCGVHWGTYLLIEDAAQASRKMPLYDGAEPNDPRFSRWQHEGQVGVQIQKGMLVLEATGNEDTRLRVGPGQFVEATPRADGAPRKHPADRRTGQGAAEARTLRLRIGSDGSAPIWASWPMRMHRAMPTSGRIKKASVSLRKRGPREEWSVEITVEEVVVDKRCGTGEVAIDLGWRKIGDEIRVMTWHGSDGRHGELRLSVRDVSGLRKASELQSIRDRGFDAAVLALTIACGACAHIPEWLASRLIHISKWSSQARLSALASQWRSNRFDGDALAYNALEAWRYHDFHLWSWQESQRIGAIRRRRESYRLLGAALASKYETLVLEKFKLTRPGFAMRLPAEASPENETARLDRQLVAPADARLVVKNSFSSRGGGVAEVDAAHTTHDCHQCGHRNTWDQAESVYCRCAECGLLWDQDRNAASNILARYCERSGDASTTVTARNGENGCDSDMIAETRWARSARLRKEKQARNVTARNSLHIDAK